MVAYYQTFFLTRYDNAYINERSSMNQYEEVRSDQNLNPLLVIFNFIS